jgi:hypothetical protein
LECRNGPMLQPARADRRSVGARLPPRATKGGRALGSRGPRFFKTNRRKKEVDGSVLSCYMLSAR